MKHSRVYLVSELEGRTRAAYDAECVEGDFDDAYRYWMHDCTLQQLRAELARLLRRHRCAWQASKTR